LLPCRHCAAGRWSCCSSATASPPLPLPQRLWLPLPLSRQLRTPLCRLPTVRAASLLHSPAQPSWLQPPSPAVSLGLNSLPAPPLTLLYGPLKAPCPRSPTRQWPTCAGPCTTWGCTPTIMTWCGALCIFSEGHFPVRSHTSLMLHHSLQQFWPHAPALYSTTFPHAPRLLHPQVSPAILPVPCVVS
jgi:hypothetical protein